MSAVRTFWLGMALSRVLALAVQAEELVPVEEHGDRSSRINLVFLAEGYTADQMPGFATDVAAVTESLFRPQPGRESPPSPE